MGFETYKPEKSAINKVVTSDSEKEKIAHEYFNDAFENQEIFNVEREKTKEELSIIKQINEKMKGFIESYEGEYISINPENIHILDTSKFIKET